MQTTPEPGVEANRRLRLALTGLLLPLVPLAACGLYLLLPGPVLSVLSVLPLPGPLFYVLSAVLYAGVFIGSVYAVVTGVRVLRGDQQQPPLQPVVRAAAGAGTVIGIAVILLLVYIVVYLVYFIRAGGAG